MLHYTSILAPVTNFPPCNHCNWRVSLNKGGVSLHQFMLQIRTNCDVFLSSCQCDIRQAGVAASWNFARAWMLLRYVITLSYNGRKPQSNEPYSSQIRINFETEQAKCLIDGRRRRRINVRITMIRRNKRIILGGAWEEERNRIRKLRISRWKIRRGKTRSRRKKNN
jgi:hypothetical protein